MEQETRILAILQKRRGEWLTRSQIATELKRPGKLLQWYEVKELDAYVKAGVVEGQINEEIRNRHEYRIAVEVGE